MPCSRPASNAVSGLSWVMRRAMTQLRLATFTLRFHNIPSGASNPFSRGASRSCRTAKAMVAERTVSSPTRDTAVRKSVTRAPAGFRAAELAIRTIWEANTGSLPNTLTMRLASAFSSARTFCMRITMCGNPGSSILPPDSSEASAWTNVKATSASPSCTTLGGGEDFCARLMGSRSGAQRLSQGVDLVLGLVDELFVGRAVDLHPLAGADVVHVELDVLRMILECGQEVSYRDDVRQVHRARVDPLQVLEVAHGRDDFFRHFPVFQERLGNGAVPVADDAGVDRLIREQARVLGRACQDVELADAVQQSGEQRRVGIDLAVATRNRVRHGSDCSAALPKRLERRLEPFERVLLLQL